MTFYLVPPTAAVDAGQPQATVVTLPKLVIAFGDKTHTHTAKKGFKWLICWAECSFALSAPCDCRFIRPTNTWRIHFREAWVIWLFKNTGERQEVDESGTIFFEQKKKIASLVDCVASHTVQLYTLLTDSHHKLTFHLIARWLLFVLATDLLVLVLKGFKSSGSQVQQLQAHALPVCRWWLFFFLLAFHFYIFARLLQAVVIFFYCFWTLDHYLCSLVSNASFVPHLLCPAALAVRESVSRTLECWTPLNNPDLGLTVWRPAECRSHASVELQAMYTILGTGVLRHSRIL